MMTAILDIMIFAILGLVLFIGLIRLVISLLPLIQFAMGVIGACAIFSALVWLMSGIA